MDIDEQLLYFVTNLCVQVFACTAAFVNAYKNVNVNKRYNICSEHANLPKERCYVFFREQSKCTEPEKFQEYPFILSVANVGRQPLKVAKMQKAA